MDISRVAVMPSMSGMLMSINTMCGQILAGQFQAGDAVIRLPHHFHVRLKRDQAADMFTRIFVVVHNQDANLIAGGAGLDQSRGRQASRPVWKRRAPPRAQAEP